MNDKLQSGKTAVSNLFPEVSDNPLLEAAILQQEEDYNIESLAYQEEIYRRKLVGVSYREVVTCSLDTPIYAAATLMSKHKVNCLFVADEQGHIIDYLTDMSLREQVIAPQVDVQQSVRQVMAQPIVSIDQQAYVYEAILLMFQHKIRYLLIEE